MDYFSQQLINGLVLGSIYGLIAIGYTMVYGIVGMINFAHGDIFMIGGFIALISFLILVSFGLTFVPVILLVVLLVAMLITALYGWTVERIAYRPLRAPFRLAPMLSAIGMSFVLTNYSQIAQGARVKPVPPIITGGYTLHEGADGFVVRLSNVQIIVVITTIVLLALFTWLVARTRLGRDMRACEQDQTMASLLGVDVDRTISMTFVIGAALAAVAGMMYLLYYGQVDFFMGFRRGHQGLHRRRARRHRLPARRDARRTSDRADRDLVVGVFLGRIQGRRRVLDPDRGADLHADRPARPSRSRKSLMAGVTASARGSSAASPAPGAAFIFKKALISALVALVLFSLMIGVRTEAGPDGQLTYMARFGDLAAMVATVFGGSIVVELLRQWWGPVGTIRIVPPSVQKRSRRRAPRHRAGAAGVHLSGAGDLLQRALHSRSRHPGADLCDAGMGTERGGRPRRPARPRLCRVLCRRRLFLRAAGDQFRVFILDLSAAGRDSRGVLRRAAGISGAAAARRLPRHRHAGVRRDHPARHHQLAEPDRRPERRYRDSPAVLLRHSPDT